MLEILGVVVDEGAGELGQGLTELREDLGADQVLYGLLGAGVGMVLDLKLEGSKTTSVCDPWGELHWRN